MWMVVFGPRKLWFKCWTSGHRRLSPILSSGATGLATVSCWTQGFCSYSCCSYSYILLFFGWVLALHLMDVSIILTFDLIFMISCITLCCSDRNFFLDGQFRCLVVSSDYLEHRDTVYTVFSWFVWWMVVMHVVLKSTGMFLHLLTYFIVFWLMWLCILVHFQMYLGGHSLISICCSCFVEFITSIHNQGKIDYSSPILEPHSWTLVNKQKTHPIL